MPSPGDAFVLVLGMATVLLRNYVHGIQCCLQMERDYGTSVIMYDTCSANSILGFCAVRKCMILSLSIKGMIFNFVMLVNNIIFNFVLLKKRLF